MADAQEILNRAVAAREQAQNGKQDPEKPNDDNPDAAKNEPESGKPAEPDEPLGPAGVRALERVRRERDELKQARADLDKTIADLTRERDQLKVDLEAAPKGEPGEPDEQHAAALDELRAEIETLTSQNKKLADEHAVDASSLMRLRVAMRKGLDEPEAKRLEATARRLVGGTEEELEADADEFFEYVGAGRSSIDGLLQKPQENLRGGAQPDEEPDEMDPDKLAAGVRGRQGGVAFRLAQ
jgi:chromosome segregation ATPase